MTYRSPKRHRISVFALTVMGAVLALAGTPSLVADVLPPAPPHRLALTLGSDTVELSDAAPNASVLLIGYERVWRGSEAILRQVQRDAVTSSTGTAVFEIGRPIEADSIWVAFDLSNGWHGAIGTPTRSVKDRTMAAGALVQAPGTGGYNQVQTSYAYQYIIAIRPGVGVWETTLADGGSADSDGETNGMAEAAITAFAGRNGSSATLTAIENGDVVAIFLPRQMAVLFNEVGK
jgi:hypothetical protein